MKIYRLLLILLIASCSWVSAFAACNAHPTIVETHLPNGSIVLSVAPNGAHYPYTYDWWLTGGQQTPTDTVRVAGRYGVLFTDSFGCSYVISDTITSLPCGLTGTLASSYQGSNVYTVTMTTAHGSNIYYGWSADAGITVSTSWDRERATCTLAPGHSGYVHCYITDSLTGCAYQDSIWLGTVCSLTSSVTTQYAGNTGFLYAAATGGHGTLIYHWSTGATTSSIATTTDGRYCVTVIDTSSCTSISCDSVHINSFTPCTGIGLFIRDTVTNGPALVAGVVYGHPLNTTYAWSNGANTASTSLSGITPGQVYCVTATDHTTNCTASMCDTICTFTASVSDSIGASDNSYTVHPSGTAPYTYYWPAWQNSYGFYQTASTSPSFVLIVTDANGCYFIDTLTPHACRITDTLAYTHDQYNHYTFAANPHNATAPVAYTWTVNGYAVAGSQNGTLSDSLPQGTFVICSGVRDAEHCSATSCDTVVVTSVLQCHINLQITDTVVGSDTLLFARVNDFTNGFVSASYSWSSGHHGTVDSILPGVHNYCVTVTDNLGCTASSCINTCTLTGAATAVASGNGWNQQATVSGAVGPVRYHWSSGDTTAGFYTTIRGVYHVTVTDSSGCSVVLSDTAGSVCYLAATIAVSGNTGSTAILTATAYNNHGPVSYLWSTGGSTSNILTIAHSGQYCVTATDSIGCAATVCDSVSLGCHLRVHVTDSTLSGYHILHAIEDSGTAPLTYLWSPAGTSAFNYVQQSGVYCVNISDANGCTASACDTVNVGCHLTVGTTYSWNAAGLYTFTPTSISGGSGAYRYTWTLDGQYIGSGYTAHYIVPAGIHTTCLSVYDSVTNCTDSACNTLQSSGPNCHFTASITQVVTGSVAVLTAHASGAHGPLTYYWPAGSTSAVLTATHSGTYCVTITDSAGCTATACDTLLLHSCSLHATYSATHTGSVYIFTGTSTGAQGPVTYQWRIDGGTPATGSPFTATLAVGTHSICMYARDTAGCRDSLCQAITVTSTTCAISGYIRDSVHHSPLIGNSHYYLPVVVNGTAPYTYHWSNGSTGAYVYTGFWQSTFNGTVTVTDANGCSAVLHINSAYVSIFCGTVFNDANGNGVQDAGEAGVSGQVVSLYSGSTFVASATTNASGLYTFSVHPGTYTIRFTAGSSYALTIPLGTSTAPNSAQYGPFTISSNGNSYCGYNFGIRNTGVTITGYVYLDANNNGVFDAGETPVANQLVHVGPHYVYTNATGFYTYTGTSGSYAITYVPSSTYSAYTVTPSSHSVNASTPGTIYASNNFGLQQHTTACNIATSIIPITTVTAGFPSYYYVYVSNYGTNVASGTMTFYYDAALTYDHAVPSAASVNASTHSASFIYAGLQPGTYTQFLVYFQTNTNVTVGQSTFEMATATDNCIESNFADNTDTLHQIATGSWDPNAKVVTPAGQGPQGLIRAGQELRYTLNFQNTGTAPAVNVVLRDSIPAALDPSTIRVLGSSHPGYVVQVEGQQLTCRYSQIMLADSFDSEPESHGFLSFAISPVAGIADGTQIQNTASIYFDYNDAVVTNTTLNTIDYTLSVQDVIGGATITVQPNPFSQYTTIRVTGADMHDAALDVYNALGQVVGTATPAAEGVFTLQRGGLSAGIYTYYIRQSGRIIGSGKLVVE